MWKKLGINFLLIIYSMIIKPQDKDYKYVLIMVFEHYNEITYKSTKEIVKTYENIPINCYSCNVSVFFYFDSLSNVISNNCFHYGDTVGYVLYVKNFNKDDLPIICLKFFDKYHYLDFDTSLNSNPLEFEKYFDYENYFEKKVVKINFAFIPLYNISLNKRFYKEGESLLISYSSKDNIYKKRIPIFNCNNKNKNKMICCLQQNGYCASEIPFYQEIIEIFNKNVGTSINLNVYYNNFNEYNKISYDFLKNIFKSVELGKEFRIRIKQQIAHLLLMENFYSNNFSFYYLPEFKITSLNITQPKCFGDKGNVNISIGGLPDVQPNDSILYLYSLYKYGNTPANNSSQINPEDHTISYNGKTYYFQTAYTSGAGNSLVSNIKIDTISPGIYKLKVYSLYTKDSTRYFPADTIFEIKALTKFIPSVAYVNSYIDKINNKTYHVKTGASTGDIIVSATGGTPPYYYKIDNGNKIQFTGSTKISLPVNNIYKVYLYDVNNCGGEGYTIDNLIPPSAIKLDMRDVSTTCNKNDGGIVIPDGMIKVKITGGIPPYKIKISEVGKYQTYLNYIVSEIYRLANNMIKPLYPNHPMYYYYDNQILFGYENTLINYCNDILKSTSNETLKMYLNQLKSYLTQLSYLTHYSDEKEFGGLYEGIYYVQVTDTTMGMIYNFADTIKSPTPLAINNIKVDTIACYNNSATVNIFTSNENIQYWWKNESNGTEGYSNDPVIRNLLPGINYSFAVKRKYPNYYDLYCSSPVIKVKMPNSPLPISFTKVDSLPVSCHNAGNGKMVINISGGRPKNYGYDISIENKNISQKGYKFENSSLLPGNYTLIVKDSLCPEIFKYNFTIRKTNDSLRINLQNSYVVDNICEQRLNGKPATGKIHISVIPGNRSSGIFRYLLKENNNTIKSEIKASEYHDFLNLIQNRYSVTVEDTTTGCVSEANFNINLSNDKISWAKDTIRVYPSSCAEVADGLVKAFVKNGIPGSSGYKYILYDSENNVIKELNSFDSANITGLYSGKNYYLRVVDDSLCYIDRGNINISSKPSDIRFLLFEKNDQWCDSVNSGLIRLKAYTAENKYIDSVFIKYPWASNKIYLTTGGDILLTNLKGYENKYVITARENIGCMKDTSILIRNLRNNPRAKVIKIDSTACDIASNGMVILGVNQTIYNGKYKFTLNNALISGSDTAKFDNLRSGKYNIVIEDIAGCKYDSTINIPVIKNPVKIEKFERIPSHCIRSADGKINLSATGGIGSEAGYMWILQNKRNNQKDTLLGKNVEFKNLRVGEQYIAYLKDKFFCADSTQMFMVLTQKDTINIATQSIKNPLCQGENTGNIIGITNNGYGALYTYQIYNILEDKEKLLKQKVDNKYFNIDGLHQGNYIIKVIDSAGCMAEVLAELRDPESIELNVNPGYVVKKGTSTGKASASASKGNNYYIYEWYKGKYVSKDSLIKKIITSGISLIDNLRAGYYIVRVADTAGCLYNGSQWLEKIIYVPEPEKDLTIKASNIKPVSCYGFEDGKIILEGEGGWGNDYLFGYDSIVLGKNNVFDNLKAGKYRFYVKDTAGVISSAVFEIIQPEILTAELVEKKDLCCYNIPEGEVKLNIRGGNKIYYLSDDGINWQRGNIIKNLKAGSYNIYVKDTFGCNTIVPVVINQPQPIDLVESIVKNTKCGKNDGSIKINVKGGIPDYNYQWYDSIRAKFIPGSDSICNIYSGIYRVTVSDANNCAYNFIMCVSDSTDLTLKDVKVFPVSCWGGNDGRAILSIEKGFPPYQVIWPDGRTGIEADKLSKGKYIVAIKDSEGCIIYPEVEITSFDSIWVEPIDLSLPLCRGVANGKIEIAAKGGAGNYVYEWNTGKKGNRLKSLDAGVYTVNITDSNNCKKQFSFALPYTDTIITGLPKKITICKNNDYILDAGKFARCLWYFNDKYIGSDKRITVNEEGKYIVEFEDDRRCIGSDTIIVKTSQTELNARFLAATTMHLNDTIIIFETSIPVPDSIKFIIPPEFKIIEKGDYYQYIVPIDTGKYDIALVGYYGDCQDIVYKEIIVYPPINIENQEKLIKLSIIEWVKIYPNPNDGNFIVEIKLKKEADAILRLLSFGDGKLVSIKQLSGNDLYTEHYQLGYLMPGMYLLNVEVNKEMRNIKIIIK